MFATTHPDGICVKTLHRYLLRHVIASTLLTAAVFTFVLMLMSALKELLPLLISQGATLGIIAQAIGLLIPFVWVFALPMGMLTASLLVFGRFSADQELTAARASGVSLLSLISPILLLSLVLCAVSAVINLNIAPRCRVAYNSLRSDLIKKTLANFQLPERRIIRDFKDYIIYVDRNRKNNLENVTVCKLKDGTNVEYLVHAPRGRMDVDVPNQKVILRLYNAQELNETMASSFGEIKTSLDVNQSRKDTGRPDISDMTFAQLQEELHKLQNLRFEEQTNSPPGDRGKKRQAQKQRGNLIEPVRLQIHRQVAFSFACFGFTLIGIPLGIRMHRRETNIGIAMALGLVAIYYTLIIIAQSLAGQPQWMPHLLMWLPNVVFQVVGAILLWRANRGM